MDNLAKRTFIIFTLLLLLFACNPASEQLKIVSNTWIGYEPIYAAKALEISQTPMQLYRTANATETMDMFENKQADVACLTLDEAMLLIEKGVPLYFAAILDISNGADQLVSQQNIKTLADLKGKKIAVETTAVGMLLLNGALEKAQLSLNDVSIVASTVDQHHQLMKNHEVSAAISFPPFSNMLTSLNVHTLYDSSEMKKAPIIDVLVVSEHAYKNKKSQLKLLLKAIYQATDLLAKHDSQIIEVIGNNLMLEPSKWSTMTDGVQFTSERLNNIYIHRYKLEATMRILDDVMLENGMLKSSIKEKITSEMFFRL